MWEVSGACAIQFGERNCAGLQALALLYTDQQSIDRFKNTVKVSNTIGDQVGQNNEPFSGILSLRKLGETNSTGF